MTRHKKSPQKTIVTRIALIGNPQLNKWKLDELNLIAKRCGILRSDIWNEYGSLKAWGVSEYTIDKLKRPTNQKYQLSAKLWEATLYDVIGDIHLVQASCLEKVLAKLNISYRKVKSKKSPEQLTLESREWLQDSRLSRLVRSCWVRGHTQVANQIVVKQYDCLTDKNGVVWIKFGGLTKGKPLKIPTTLPAEIKGQIRLIKQENNWYIHYPVEREIPPKKETGLTIGIDRGYSEVYVTSSNDGNRFIGQEFGSIQTAESDYRKEKGVKRNKLRAIAEKAEKK
jgi:transposase